MFRDTEKVTSVESGKLRKTFGPYSASLATKAFENVQELVKFLPEEYTITAGNKKITKHYFGHNVNFSLDFTDKNFDELFAEAPEDKPEEIQGDRFVEQFKSKLFIDNNGPLPVSENTNEVVVAGATADSYSGAWLRRHCKKFLEENSSSLALNDLVTAIFDILASTKPNEAIQNELFELLGFNAFDMIQELLENRQTIVHETLQEPSSLEAPPEVNRHIREEVKQQIQRQGPVVGVSVMVSLSSIYNLNHCL